MWMGVSVCLTFNRGHSRNVIQVPQLNWMTFSHRKRIYSMTARVPHIQHTVNRVKRNYRTNSMINWRELNSVPAHPSFTAVSPYCSQWLWNNVHHRVNRIKERMLHAHTHTHTLCWFGRCFDVLLRFDFGTLRAMASNFSGPEFIIILYVAFVRCRKLGWWILCHIPFYAEMCRQRHPKWSILWRVFIYEIGLWAQPSLAADDTASLTT